MKITGIYVEPKKNTWYFKGFDPWMDLRGTFLPTAIATEIYWRPLDLGGTLGWVNLGKSPPATPRDLQPPFAARIFLDPRSKLGFESLVPVPFKCIICIYIYTKYSPKMSQIFPVPWSQGLGGIAHV